MKTLLQYENINGINFYKVGSLEDSIIPNQEFIDKLAIFLGSTDDHHGVIFGPTIDISYDEDIDSYIFNYGSVEHNIIPTPQEISDFANILVKFFKQHSIGSSFEIISAK